MIDIRFCIIDESKKSEFYFKTKSKTNLKMDKAKILSVSFLMYLLMSLNGVQAQSIFDKWEALKSFHEVMSETFHPLEDGNLEPIKTRSLEMSEKASMLTKNVPAEFNTPGIVDAARRLDDGCSNLNEMITNNASDEEIKKSLTSMHDVFHEIAGLCSDTDKHETENSNKNNTEKEIPDPSK